MSSLYCNIDYLKSGARIMLPAEIDRIEQQSPGIVNGTIEQVSLEFNSLLHKRYAAPFENYPSPECPGAVSSNVAWVTIERLWNTYGASPTNSDKSTRIQAMADQARAWLREAADSEKGLVELPIREDSSASAVNQGGPLVSSQQSPYAWTDDQAEIGRQEDSRG